MNNCGSGWYIEGLEMALNIITCNPGLQANSDVRLVNESFFWTIIFGEPDEPVRHIGLKLCKISHMKQHRPTGVSLFILLNWSVFKPLI